MNDKVFDAIRTFRGALHRQGPGARPVAARASFGCVVLTQGKRPDELRRGLESLLAQEGVDLDVVVVGNGWAPSGLPDGVRGVERETDEGIPAGRNFGVPHVRGELLFFLDDDASLAQPDALARVAEKFAADPRLGLVQLRVDPGDPAPAAARVGAAAARRRPRPQQRRHARLGGRRRRSRGASSRRSASGRPRSASCTRASTSAGG